MTHMPDDAPPPVQCAAGGADDPLSSQWEESIPEWIAALSPGLPAADAATVAKEWTACAVDLARQVISFVPNASRGQPCRLLCQATGKAVPATYTLTSNLRTLCVEGEAPHDRLGEVHECQLADMRNIWVCADSALARRVHGSIHSDLDADLACVVLIDVPSGPLGLVMRSSEAREEFLDCMAVLIAFQRLRTDPGLPRCALPGGLPPPEARLRPFGRSLQSEHLSGPICVWLARVGEDVLTNWAQENTSPSLPLETLESSSPDPPKKSEDGASAVHDQPSRPTRASASPI